MSRRLNTRGLALVAIVVLASGCATGNARLADTPEAASTVVAEPCEPGNADRPSRLAITVTDVTGAPLPRASVALARQGVDSQLALTADDGSAALSVPSSRPFDVEVSLLGFRPVTLSTLSVSAGCSLRARVTLVVPEMNLPCERITAAEP